LLEYNLQAADPDDSDDDGSMPLAREIFERLPVRHFAANERLPQDKQCFCLVEYEPGDEIVTLLCNHQYHKDCIQRWFRESSLCPIDRI